MSIMSSLYDYLITCPFLKQVDGYAMLYVDYSKNDETVTYSLNEVPCNPVIKTYITGDTLNQFLFTVTSVENYGSDSDLNTSNLKFYEDFSKWIRTNDKNGILPEMEEDKNATKIECLTGGYMIDNSSNAATARYIIQMKLTYDQEY
ncbi:chloramphenicol resistance protein [Clostridium beijerinckii]|uniref:chloramphenicol resistance protein n=1 Tax=Clostridium beijerinckii TaxID=1520 RepID=UPI001F3B0045|nr:chloramphenicol resistance protein [Clostridium beijerinckii]